MTEIKHKSYILATIDHLRARKARPDIDRICRFMLKKFKVNFKETKADLKRCVDAEFVCKVDYKGNVSYRNAAKWKKELKSSLDNSKTGNMKSSSSADRSLMNIAIAELIFIDPDYSEQGVPLHKLMKAIALKENLGYSKKCLEGIIQKQLTNGGLIKMANGNFALGPGDTDQDSIDYSYTDTHIKMTSSNNSSSTSSPMRMKLKPGRKKGSSTVIKVPPYAGITPDAKRETAVRVGERRKRAKKVFDPSDNNVPSKKKRGRPAGSLNKATLKKQNVSASSSVTKEADSFEHKTKSESGDSSEEGDNETNDARSAILAATEKVTGGVCSVCRHHKRADGHNTEKLVGCRDCSNKAHPSCLQGDGMLRLRPDNTWQCPHCKTCVVCIETNDAGVLTVCSVCADAYHALCHSPAIPEKSKAWDQWECRNCQETRNSGPNMDTSYMDKIRGSDRSSKYSERSDSIKSSLGRRSGKSSDKSIDSDDKMESKLVISEKDDHSSSPISTEKHDWNTPRMLNSPGRNPCLNWRKGDKETTELRVLGKDGPNVNAKKSKSSVVTEDKNHKRHNMQSIFMDDYEFNKCYQNATYTKHPYDRDEITIDTSIPDAQKWSYNDVYEYFSSYFPEQAHVFKEQEIDGKCLLMMRRSDVISSFGLPLGLGLKLYRHVVKLQSRKDDFTMCWL